MNFLRSFLISVVSFLVVAGAVYAFTNPSGTPPNGGSTIITTDSTRGLGIATTTIYSNQSAMKFVTQGGSNQHIVFLPNGYVGIATATPARTLDVNGTIRATTFEGIMSSAVSAINVSSGIFASSTGGGIFAFPAALGVGTSTTTGFPTNGLYVEGDIVSKGSITATGTITATTINVTNNITAKQIYSPMVVKGNSGTSMTIDWNDGSVQHVTLTGNCTFTFSNGQSGGRYTLLLKQDTTGGRTVTWPSSVRWPGATAPTLSASSSATDYVGFVYNSVDSKYDGVAVNLGF